MLSFKKKPFKEQSVPTLQVWDKYFSHHTARGTEAQKQAISPRLHSGGGAGWGESSDLAQAYIPSTRPHLAGQRLQQAE